MDIPDRVVVITGASSGIGEATARVAHSRGAHVVLAARREDRLATLEKELEGSLAVTADVTRAGDRRRIVDAALERSGRVDVLVNNAGRGLHLPLEEVDPEDYAAILDLNVGSALAMMQAVVPPMRERGQGAIVNSRAATSAPSCRPTRSRSSTTSCRPARDGSAERPGAATPPSTSPRRSSVPSRPGRRRSTCRTPGDGAGPSSRRAGAVRHRSG